MPTQLRDYQATALDQIHLLQADGVSRATLPLPCGTGKTVVAAHLIHQVGGRTVMFVPTVELLAQTLRRIRVDNPDVPTVAVCSDSHVGEAVTEEAEAAATGVEVTTQVDDLAFLLESTPNQLVVVSTYASAQVVAAATERAGLRWDLMVCDEAHRTAGLSRRLWSLPVSDEAIPAAFRLFMTATTRTIQPPVVPEDWPDPEDLEVVSMDSLADYGPHLSTITMRQAIDQGILADYEVAIVGVSGTEVLELMAESGDSGKGEELDVQAAACQLALLHARDTHPELRSVLAFHNRVADSKQWSRQFRSLAAVDDRAGEVNVFHVDGTSASKHRTQALNALEQPGDRMTVVSNVRLFGEGVDVPSLDAVLFAAPRTSTNDIVQIVGRSLRKNPDNPAAKALIVLPVVFDDTSGRNEAVVAANSSHAAAWQVVMSLADVDEHVQRSLVQLQFDLMEESTGPTAKSGTVSVDTSMLAVGASLPFSLRILSKTTGHHPQTVARLKSWAQAKGNANPPARAVWHDYPLGARVKSAREAKRRGTLDAQIAALYEQVPGFRWEPPRRSGRSADSWIDLMERYLSATGAARIERFSQAFDPATGQKMAIGQKLHSFRWVSGLSVEQKQRLLKLGLEVPGLG